MFKRLFDISCRSKDGSTFIIEMKKVPKEFPDPTFKRLFMLSEIGNFTAEEHKQYIKSPMKKWHAIRVTYGREMKFGTCLDEAGFETFIPMTVKEIEKDGHKGKITVPAISNLLFVRAEQQELYEFFKSKGEACPARFIWDKSTTDPIVVPDKAMADFITVSTAMLDDTIYLSELNSTLRAGQLVRIKEGPFKGVEGRIVRIRKSRRILVEIPGMLSVAATYIPSENLEPSIGNS